MKIHTWPKKYKSAQLTNGVIETDENDVPSVLQLQKYFLGHNPEQRILSDNLLN